MSETLQAALIALGGVAVGGLLTGWFQRANTKTLISAELNKLYVHLEGEARKHLLGRKQDELMGTVPDLVAAADPELHAKFDYARLVTLVHRVQLVLDPSKATDARLNQAASDLGFAIQAAVTGERDVARILRAQAEVIDATRELLRQSA